MEPSECFERKLARLAENAKISPRNRQLIGKFYEKMLCEGLSQRRILKYLNYLGVQAAVLGLDFDAATKEDLQLLDFMEYLLPVRFSSAIIEVYGQFKNPYRGDLYPLRRYEPLLPWEAVNGWVYPHDQVICFLEQQAGHA